MNISLFSSHFTFLLSSRTRSLASCSNNVFERKTLFLFSHFVCICESLTHIRYSGNEERKEKEILFDHRPPVDRSTPHKVCPIHVSLSNQNSLTQKFGGTMENEIALNGFYWISLIRWRKCRKCIVFFFFWRRRRQNNRLLVWSSPFGAQFFFPSEL